MRKISKPTILYVPTSILAILLLMLCASRLYFDKPYTETDATVEDCQYYVISAEGAHDSLYIMIYNNADTIVARPTDKAFIKSITRKRKASWINRWWFPSCHGTLASRIDTLAETPITSLHNDSVRNVLSFCKAKVRTLADVYARQRKEVDYYLSSHDVRDEGFDAVVRRSDVIDRKQDSLASILQAIEALGNHKSLKAALRRRCKVVFRDGDKSMHVPCSQTEGSRSGFMLFQTDDAKTPSSARPVFLYADSIGRGNNISPNLLPPADSICKGSFDKSGRLSGFGQVFYRNGHYYEGMFLDGKRHDFGVGFDEHVKVGKWKDGKYMGEQPVYSAAHIYGIDISRYQHEKGKKRFKINWSQLRITSLGSLSKKKIEDNVNYPVSFVYIKCSQGTNILNRYYTNDYKQSRRHGYRTGSYHFLSTKTSGIQQARYFLKHCIYKKGDLPPVLDVEPTEAQIRKMGGDAALHNLILSWMRHVESALGVRPVLYCSQTFINRHLSGDSYIKKKYNVWIARYGEYKPDVHMVYWQICPDGRVSGIRTEVDINVFNGYSTAFNEFITRH